MARTMKLKELCIAIGRKKSQISAWATERPGFPFDLVNGERLFDPIEVQAWIDANINPRRGRRAAMLQAAHTAPLASAEDPSRGVVQSSHTAPLPSQHDPLIVSMRSGLSSALDISRAAMQLASRRFADAAIAGTVGANHLDDLKKSLQELRQAESDYVEISEKQGLLILRSTFNTVTGQMVARLNACFDQLCQALAVQVDQWLIDQAVKSLDTETRQRMVRSWAEKAAFDIRNLEANEVDRMLKVEKEESSQ